MLLLTALFGCQQGTDALIDRELDAMSDTTALSDGGLHVVFGGTGTLSTDADRAGSSVAILAADRVLLFDVGPGSTRVLGSNGVPLGHVEAVFLTHFHSDHYGDLGELTVASELLGRSEPLVVYGPAGVGEVVEGFEQAYAVDHRNRSAQHPGHLQSHAAESQVVELTPTASEVVYEQDGLVVTAFLVDHEPVDPAYGYRVDYAGRSVVLSGDTRATDAVVAAAEGADLLIHEAMDKELAEQVAVVAERRGDARTAGLIRDALPNHSTASDAARVAELAGVDRLALTHISPPLVSPHHRWRLRRRARRAYDGPVLLAKDGLRIDL